MSAESVRTLFTPSFPSVSSDIEGRHLSRFERFFVRRFHPRRIMIDLAAGPWIVYFLWQNDAVRALIIAVVFGVLGLASVWRTDPERLATTVLGKVGLLHLHPMNFTLQLLSLYPIVFGIWTHETELLLIGVSTLFAGHTFGWDGVDSRFAYAD